MPWDKYKCDEQECGRQFAIEQPIGDEIEEPSCPECGCTNSIYLGTFQME
jgi:Zinc ribbon domain.